MFCLQMKECYLVATKGDCKHGSGKSNFHLFVVFLSFGTVSRDENAIIYGLFLGDGREYFSFVLKIYTKPYFM